MNIGGNQKIIQEFLENISDKGFTCVAARAANAKHQVHCMVAENMYCPKDDVVILAFLYKFIDAFRRSEDLFHSAAIVFKGPVFPDEETFDQVLWQRLQSLSNLDAVNYKYDKRVSADPASSDFSFSLKEEAFFIIGMHQNSSRQARKFGYPALIFNPHAQFETLRKSSSYDKLKNVVRNRDILSSGSVNPMLEDFGNSSEVFQYSGRNYDKSWECPLNINHAGI